MLATAYGSNIIEDIKLLNHVTHGIQSNHDYVDLRLSLRDSYSYYVIVSLENLFDFIHSGFREHFDEAITVDHLRSAMDMEYRELQIWEKKALLQERLFSFMISEDNIDRIVQLSPYDNIRKEAKDLLKGSETPPLL